jgi:hypothetical protein
MATDAAVFFEEGDVEMSVQEMRAGKTGDACSDDGNFALQNGY